MKRMQSGLLAAPAPRPVLSGTSPAWKYARAGENRSPAFEFHSNLGTNPGPVPEGLRKV
jgi:hypothetical protein